jgi:hypothetical protein
MSFRQTTPGVEQLSVPVTHEVSTQAFEAVHPPKGAVVLNLAG